MQVSIQIWLQERRRGMFKNKTYDTLKYIAQIVLPAIATLCFALASIWGLPYGEQIVGTITAIDAFLGAILGISTAQYNKRQEVTDNEQ
jgi:hypothetical protein